MNRDLQVRREYIKSCYPGIKEMYLNGYLLGEIANYFGISLPSVSNAITKMGLPGRKTVIDESKLIYANHRVIFTRMLIDGKCYVDVTPLFLGVGG